MDQAFERVLAEYEARSAREEAEIAGLLQDLPPGEALTPDQFLLAVGPGTGRLLNVLVKETGARSILELGTSYGYSALWLAEAAHATGGKLITVDVHAGKQAAAQAALTRAGLASHVEFRLGDVLAIIPQLKLKFDLVLLDVWKDLYVPCFDLFYPKLSPGALVLADNMLQPEFARPDAEKYRRHVRSKAGMDSVLLPIGSGVELSRYMRGL